MNKRFSCLFFLLVLVSINTSKLFTFADTINPAILTISAPGLLAPQTATWGDEEKNGVEDACAQINNDRRSHILQEHHC